VAPLLVLPRQAPQQLLVAVEKLWTWVAAAAVDTHATTALRLFQPPVSTANQAVTETSDDIGCPPSSPRFAAATIVVFSLVKMDAIFDDF
jgi:hypothetical protein